MTKPQSLTIGTPFYLGDQATDYGESILELYAACWQRKIKVSKADTWGDAVNRSRNVISSFYLAKESDKLLFADSDTGFRAEDVLRMYDMNLPVVVANYPLRSFNWEAGCGRVFDTPEQLKTALLKPSIMPVEGAQMANGAVEIAYGGTGLMMIDRNVFLDIIKNQLIPKLEHGLGATPETVKFFWRFFAFTVKDGDDCGEDWSFCDLVRAAGHKVYCDPQAICSHTGPYTWSGKPDWPKHCMAREIVEKRKGIK